MERASGPAAAIRRAGSLALITGLLGTAGLNLAGCTSSSPSPGAGSSPGTATASASPGLSVPGTHQATSRYQIDVGPITVRVPGTVSYKVAADTRVGKTTISAPQSDSSGHAITATTDVGAIVVAPAP